MDALDALELDVGGRRRARDEDDRAPIAGGRGEAGDQLGHGLDDLLLADDADVEVGHECDRAAALALAAVERDRARLGTRRGTGRQGAVEPVELGRREATVFDQLDLGRRDRVRQIG